MQTLVMTPEAAMPLGSVDAEEMKPRLTSPTDTLTTLSRIVEVDPAVLERERILPPGAGGPNGGAYKMLRTQVLRRLDKLGANTLAVVGTAPGTGKTLTAINLAIAVAADPERT